LFKVSLLIRSSLLLATGVHEIAEGANKRHNSSCSINAKVTWVLPKHKRISHRLILIPFDTHKLFVNVLWFTASGNYTRHIQLCNFQKLFTVVEDIGVRWGNCFLVSCIELTVNLKKHSK